MLSTLGEDDFIEVVGRDEIATNEVVLARELEDFYPWLLVEAAGLIGWVDKETTDPVITGYLTEELGHLDRGREVGLNGRLGVRFVSEEGSSLLYIQPFVMFDSGRVRLKEWRRIVQRGIPSEKDDLRVPHLF